MLQTYSNLLRKSTKIKQIGKMRRQSKADFGSNGVKVDKNQTNRKNETTK